MKKTLLIINIVIFSFVQMPAFAQTNMSVDKLQETLSVTTTPEIPTAFESVTIGIESFAHDLNSSNIEWYLNKKLILRGVGRKTFTFTTGDIGTNSEVIVSISPKNGGAFEKKFAFRPAGVNLLWQANTHTHPFYKGKAQFTDQSMVTVTAIPDFVNAQGKRILPEALIYTWTQNETIRGSFSGYGKNVYRFNGSVLGIDEEISLDVTTSDKTLRAKKTITLQSTRPKVVLYENHPLFGYLFNNAITGPYALKEKEVSFVVVPYFIGSQSNSLDIVDFQWFVNGSRVEKNEKNIITLRNDANISGTSILKIFAQNKRNDSQNAEQSIQINLQKQ